MDTKWEKGIWKRIFCMLLIVIIVMTSEDFTVFAIETQSEIWDETASDVIDNSVVEEERENMEDEVTDNQTSNTDEENIGMEEGETTEELEKMELLDNETNDELETTEEEQREILSGNQDYYGESKEIVPDIILDNGNKDEAIMVSTENVWSGEIAKKYAGGNGTEDNPYQIANGEQLAKLAKEDSNQNYFILIRNIYLNDVSDSDWNFKENINEWVPIENFKGDIDGQNHTVYGLYGGSLFGKSMGTIRNINIDKSYVTSGYGEYVGAIAGWASVIYGCSNLGEVHVNNTKKTYVGGIAGYVNTVKECYNSGTIYGYTSDESSSGTIYVGGIAGRVPTLVDQCFNTGYVSSKGEYDAAAGGIVGLSGATVRNAYNSGKVEAYGGFSYSGYSFSGGIVGDCRFQGTAISYCYDVGSLYNRGSFYCGSIVGISSRFSSPTLTNCYCRENHYMVGKATSSSYCSYSKVSCNELTESQMRDLDSFEGFNNEIWCVNNLYNDGYPIFQLQIKEKNPIEIDYSITFTDSPYSIYTDYEVLVMAKIANGSNLTENDFTWKNNDENVATIVSTSNGQLGDVGYAFATVRGTGKTLGYGSLTLTLSDGRSARCGLICVGEKSNEKQPSYQITAEPKNGYELLVNYGNKWEKEYNAYVQAVSDSLYKYASSDTGKRDTMIAAMAYKMQQEDNKSSSKHLSFEAAFPSDWNKSDVYTALATYLCDNTSSKMDFGGNIKEKNIAKTVLNAMSSSSVDYTFGNIAMTVSAFQFSGARTGSITCYDKSHPNKKYTVVICSTKAECTDIIQDYYNQLVDLENAAIYNLYTAIGQDILGKPVSTFTEKWLRNHLSKYISQLNQTGVGDLYNTLKNCNEYYKFISKISSGDMDAAESLVSTMAGLKFDDTTIEDRVVKKAMQKLNKAGKELNKAFMEYVSGNLEEGWLQKKFSAIFTCPVNISVWNENGDQLGYVGEDDIWYTDAISIEENSDAKIINSYTNEKLTFTISGTDYGVLGCSIEEYDIGNEPIGRVNFYDIPLEEDAVFTLDMPDALSESSESIYMSALDGSKIAADEYISAEEEGGVDIACVIETDDEMNGGTVSGYGTYVRGDAAVLLATPEAGYRFAGWYQDDVLLTASKVYEFTAKEDIKLKALFHHEKNEYTVTFDVQSHGTAPYPYEVEEGDLIEEPATPIAEGYTFTGWYKEESCENKWDFESDTVQGDITLYAGWVENGTSGGETGDPNPEQLYTITFSTKNHGTPPSPYTDLKAGSKITEPAPPASEGYIFTGWFKDAECTLRWNFDIDVVESDMTLYAGWVLDNGYGDVLPEDIPTSGEIPAGLWIAAIPDYTYTGQAIKPQVRVYDANRRLKQGQDYTVTYKNNIKANDASNSATAPKVIIKGKGSYAGTETATFAILPISLNDTNVITEDITVSYNNKVQKIVPTITYNGKKLSNNKDFIVSYPDFDKKVTEAYCAAGTYDILLTAKEGGNYADTRTVKLTITKSSLINKATIKKIPNQSYTGYEIEPEPTVSIKNTSLIKDTDYTVTYINNKEIGKATVILTGIGEYAGTKKVTFNITGVSLKKAVVSGIENQVYNGSEQKPSVTLTLDGTPLYEETDYKITYADNTNVGKATITIKGINAYTGTIKKTFKITAYDIKADAANQIRGLEQEITAKYLKGGSKPKLELTFVGKKLTEGTDYSVSYKNNKEVTTDVTKKQPTITIKGKGNFKGILSKTYTITSKALNDKESPVVLRAADKGFKDKAGNYISKPVLTDADGKKLVSGKDYEREVIYTLEVGTLLTKEDRMDVGTIIKARVIGKGAYTGELETSYQIKEEDFSKAKISIMPQTYTGKEITLDKDDIAVKLRGGTLDWNSDYEIVGGSYVNNIKKGTAEVMVAGKGNYGGTKTVKFKITSKRFEWFWRMFE